MSDWFDYALRVSIDSLVRDYGACCTLVSRPDRLSISLVRSDGGLATVDLTEELLDSRNAQRCLELVRDALLAPTDGLVIGIAGKPRSRLRARA